MSSRRFCCAFGAALAVWCLATGLANAGPWPRPPGEHFNRSEFEMFASRHGEQQFRQLVVRDYAEFGLGEALTIGGQLAAVTQEAQGPGYLERGTGTAEAEMFAILHQRRRGGRASGLRVTGGLGTAKFARGQRIIGQDSYLGVAYLHGVGSDRAFAILDAGVRASLGDDADQLRLGGRLGVKHRGAMVILESFNTVAISGPSGTGVDFDLGQISLSAVLPLRDALQVEIGGRIDTFTRNIGRGQSVFVAMWWTV